ncbi:MAG: 50S ribosomal protein L24 [Pirellulales bacterium]|jgi:large subunit ribosomal protein L24|nr:50S ribosomal protein L24 [Pirellulales bacterium]
MHIRVDDTVEVVAGADKGTRGRVLKIVKGNQRVVVEGVNRVKKHVQRSQKNPRGGQLSKEMPISISNIRLVCSACGSLSRTGVRYQADGTKERFCKKCGNGIGEIAPAKAAYTKS